MPAIYGKVREIVPLKRAEDSEASNGRCQPYYSDSLGRFTSVDPIWVNGDRVLDPRRLNLYVYGLNNPLIFNDPTGMDVTLGRCSSFTATDVARQ